MRQFIFTTLTCSGLVTILSACSVAPTTTAPDPFLAGGRAPMQSATHAPANTDTETASAAHQQNQGK